MIAVVNGKEIKVNWMWLFPATDLIMAELTDARAASVIAEEWENSAVIERKSAEEGDKTYEGYTQIKRLTREKKNGVTTVHITLEKEE